MSLVEESSEGGVGLRITKMRLTPRGLDFDCQVYRDPNWGGFKDPVLLLRFAEPLQIRFVGRDDRLLAKDWTNCMVFSNDFFLGRTVEHT